MAATTPRPDTWIDEAPERVTESIEVEATAAEVWAVLVDHERWPEWFTALKGVEVTGAASGVGAERRVTLPGMVIDEEFVAWDENERFAFTVVGLSRPVFTTLNERVELEEIGPGRTRVTYHQAFEPKGWFRLPFHLLKRQFRRGLRQGLDGLAGHLGSNDS